MAKLSNEEAPDTAPSLADDCHTDHSARDASERLSDANDDDCGANSADEDPYNTEKHLYIAENYLISADEDPICVDEDPYNPEEDPNTGDEDCYTADHSLTTPNKGHLCLQCQDCRVPLDAYTGNLTTPERLPKDEFYDDGTMTFLWRAHTMTMLGIIFCGLLYEAVTPVDEVGADNIKRGLAAVLFNFLVIIVTITPDGPFKRPHPALWRFSFGLSIVYLLGLVFMLFQSPQAGRELLTHFDANLAKPMEEKSYGGTCLLYDPSMPESPYHNIWDKMDLFVPLHLFGWFLKTLVLRDWWLCMVISFFFEILEYTLEHQLPNFSECWWDHWIMDWFVCNSLGIYFGMIVIKKLKMKTYHWRGLWNIPSYRGKLRRILGQFGPYVWIDYDWQPMASIGRWGAVLALIATFLLVELNTFYLKFVLWIPPGHCINLVRLFGVLMWGAVAIREGFQLIDDPDVDKIGRQSVVFLAIIFTEFLISVKFGWDTITIPFPSHVVVLWSLIAAVIVLWTVWNFYIDPHTVKAEDRHLFHETKRLRWNKLRAMETKLSPQSPKTFVGEEGLSPLSAQVFCFDDAASEAEGRRGRKHSVSEGREVGDRLRTSCSEGREFRESEEALLSSSSPSTSPFSLYGDKTSRRRLNFA